jgi:nuclear transport factor 2 (NTF2) superfamily protein
VQFRRGKWERELDHRLIEELWACTGDVIAVRFAYEHHAADGSWFRAYGNEHWRFDADGLMTHRYASVNDVPIDETDRLFHRDASGPRPADHPGLSELGL